MRRTLLASLFALALPVVAAGADETQAPPPETVQPAPVQAVHPRLVGVILSSAQALLWDEERGEYVLHKVGDDFVGGRIVELDADHIVIERGEARDVIELSAPPQTRVAAMRRPRRMPAMIISAVQAPATVTDAAAANAGTVAPSAVQSAPAMNAVPSAAVDPAAVPAPGPASQAGAAPAAAAAPQAAVAPPAIGTPQAVAAPEAAAASQAPVATAPVATAPQAMVVPAPQVAGTASTVAPQSAAAPSAVAPQMAVVAPAAAPQAIAPPAVAGSNVPQPAPVAPSAAPVASPPAPVAPPPAAAAPVTQTAAPVAPSTNAAPTATAPATAPATATVIPRADLDRALADFGSLSQQLQVTPNPRGGFRLSQLQPGSFFARAGLRNEDIVKRIDNRPINGVDDAAAAYAWLRVTNRFSVDIVRDGRPMTLRYVIAPSQPLTADAQN